MYWEEKEEILRKCFFFIDIYMFENYEVNANCII